MVQFFRKWIPMWTGLKIKNFFWTTIFIIPFHIIVFLCLKIHFRFTFQSAAKYFKSGGHLVHRWLNCSIFTTQFELVKPGNSVSNRSVGNINGSAEFISSSKQHWFVLTSGLSKLLENCRGVNIQLLMLNINFYFQQSRSQLVEGTLKKQFQTLEIARSRIMKSTRKENVGLSRLSRGDSGL